MKWDIFVSFKPPRPGIELRTLAWKAAVLTTTLVPPPSTSTSPIRWQKVTIPLKFTPTKLYSPVSSVLCSLRRHYFWRIHFWSKKRKCCVCRGPIPCPQSKPHKAAPAQQTQNICLTFVQRRPNVFDAGPTLYKCYTNVWGFSGGQPRLRTPQNLHLQRLPESLAG